jgi:dihydrofolate reductase
MITIIVAADQDLLIGKKGTKNGMPWSNLEDLKHFKKTTLNHTVLFGMNTFKAMGSRPLPKRKTIILTRSDFTSDEVEVRHQLEDVIQEYKDRGEDLFICGGANIYKQALPLADEILLSRIPGKHTGETYFPSFDDMGYTCVEKKPFETFTLEVYRRV